MSKETIYFSKVKPNAIIPSKNEGNAGRDVYACFDTDYIIINPHQTIMIPTGIASACSNDYYFQLFERGSTGTKGIGQRCGVIDSSYRGEWFVPITNHNKEHIAIFKKSGCMNEERIKEWCEDDVIIYPYEKAICQAVLLPVPKVDVEEVDYATLKSFTSERGLGCLGSSNK